MTEPADVVNPYPPPLITTVGSHGSLPLLATSVAGYCWSLRLGVRLALLCTISVNHYVMAAFGRCTEGIASRGHRPGAAGSFPPVATGPSGRMPMRSLDRYPGEGRGQNRGRRGRKCYSSSVLSARPWAFRFVATFHSLPWGVHATSTYSRPQPRAVRGVRADHRFTLGVPLGAEVLREVTKGHIICLPC